MKPHHSKQNSLEFKVTSSLNNEVYTHNTTQTLARTYRKKTQASDSHPLLSLHNGPLSRYPLSREPKKSLGKQMEHRSAEKKSQPKVLNERSIERLRAGNRANEANTLSHKSKMAKIVAVLSVRAGGDGREVLGQVYEANSAFEGLLQEWRRLDICDEADELLARLVENYTAVIEGVALGAYGLAEESLRRSEGQISHLQAENQSLRSLLQLQASRFELQIMEAENRLYEEFEKAQWGTFILNELSRRAFHLDHFVRSSEVYANAKAEYLSNGLHKCYTRSRGGGRPERNSSEAKGSVVEDIRLKPQLASIPQLRNLSQFS